MVLIILDSYKQKNETGPLFIPDTKINSGWINAKLETIKLGEESVSNTLFDIRNSTLDMSPQSREMKGKISKWYYIKLKSFSTHNYQQNKKTTC